MVRQALQAWADWLDAIIAPTPAAVIPIGTKARDHRAAAQSRSRGRRG
jgi:hypothetical protein